MPEQDSRVALVRIEGLAEESNFAWRWSKSFTSGSGAVGDVGGNLLVHDDDRRMGVLE